MADFEIAYVSKSGTSFCESGYDIEGDFPFIVSSYINVLKYLNVG